VTRRQGVLVALGGGVILIVGFALGFALSSRNQPEATPTPTSDAATCQVSVSPTTIVVDPDRLDVTSTVFIAGAGFPPSSGVTLMLPGEALDLGSDASGSFSYVLAAAAGDAYPLPPDLEPGAVTWTVIGWDSPQAPPDSGSIPPKACETQVTVTIELTGSASATPAGSPPTDLVPGGYAEVLADGVRVRIEPSLDATVTGALFIGDVVRILEPAQAAEGLIWYRVESVVTGGGEYVRGYVAAAGSDGQAFLAPTDEPPSPTPSPSPSPSP
jgi:hypothetical protein